MVLTRAGQILRLGDSHILVHQPWRSYCCLQVKHIQQQKKVQVNQLFVRTKTVVRKKARKFRPKYERDDISKDYRLIYDNNLNRVFFWYQIGVYGLTIPSIGLSAKRIFTSLYGDISMSYPLATSVSYILFGSLLLTFTSVICRRSIIRMYHEPVLDRYVAIVQNSFMIRSKLPFSIQDVRYKEPSVMKGFTGNVQICNRTFIIAPGDFTVPMYFNRFMGWDHDYQEYKKDIDLKDIRSALRKKKL